jgi:hypothetical protein
MNHHAFKALGVEFQAIFGLRLHQKPKVQGKFKRFIKELLRHGFPRRWHQTKRSGLFL